MPIFKLRLQQGFAVRERGLRGQVARQQFHAVHVADGVKSRHSRRNEPCPLYPESGHQRSRWECPLWAISGHSVLLTKTHSRSQKRLIGRLSNTTERNCTYDRDGDCPNACKDEGSHDRWLDQDIP
jgi:hypothetical protein